MRGWKERGGVHHEEMQRDIRAGFASRRSSRGNAIDCEKANEKRLLRTECGDVLNTLCMDMGDGAQRLPAARLGLGRARSAAGAGRPLALS